MNSINIVIMGSKIGEQKKYEQVITTPRYFRLKKRRSSNCHFAISMISSALDLLDTTAMIYSNEYRRSWLYSCFYDNSSPIKMVYMTQHPSVGNFWSPAAVMALTLDNGYVSLHWIMSPLIFLRQGGIDNHPQKQIRRQSLLHLHRPLYTSYSNHRKFPQE